MSRPFKKRRPKKKYTFRAKADINITTMFKDVSTEDIVDILDAFFPDLKRERSAFPKGDGLQLVTDLHTICPLHAGRLIDALCGIITKEAIMKLLYTSKSRIQKQDITGTVEAIYIESLGDFKVNSKFRNLLRTSSAALIQLCDLILDQASKGSGYVHTQRDLGDKQVGAKCDIIQGRKIIEVKVSNKDEDAHLLQALSYFTLATHKATDRQLKNLDSVAVWNLLTGDIITVSGLDPEGIADFYEFLHL